MVVDDSGGHLKPGPRKVEVVILSDVHLGTYGCHAKELVRYLKSIRPEHLILNGDIIDIWQFSKRYFPKSHLKVIHQITRMMSKGTKVTYITGNHDELLRKFTGFSIPGFRIKNKTILELDGKQAWIFHGDVFDVSMQHARWLTKLGSTGYDLLILLNRAVNWLLARTGREKISFSKRVKDSVKKAVQFINQFEQLCADIAIEKRYDYVVCGHIHHPEIKKLSNKNGEVTYLNSGDWVENLSALEYHEGEWKLYRYSEDRSQNAEVEEPEKDELPDAKELFASLVKEFEAL